MVDISQPPLLSIRHGFFSYQRRPLLTDVTLHLYSHEKVCLMGRNGSGKSSLMRLLQGDLVLDQGSYFLQPYTTIASLAQHPILPPRCTIAQHVWESPLPIPGELLEALTHFQLAPDTLLEHLSGGEARRVSILKTLFEAGDIVCLDEPTNHLDILGIAWLEAWIKRSSKSFILVSHDRAFLSNTTQTTWWLEQGRVYRCPDGFEKFEAWQEAFLEEEARRLETLNTHLAQEMRWLHRGVTARRRRNQGRLRKLEGLREQKRAWGGGESPKIKGTTTAVDPLRQLLEIENLTVSLPSKRILVKDLSFRLLKGERLGIVGPNGCGKTTLLSVLQGDASPTAGWVRRPQKMQWVTFQQGQPWEDLSLTPWRYLCPQGGDQVSVQGMPRNVIAYLKEFLFTSDQMHQEIRLLSGGERNRLRLAKLLAYPVPLLILDEPTNDLDLETIDFLQDYLLSYDGTLIIVSHDRDFLDQVATSLLVFESHGKVQEFVGSFSEYIKTHGGLFNPSIPTSKSAAKKVISPEIPKVRSSRLSYHEVRLLEVLPQQIEMWEVEKKRLSQEIMDPNTQPDFKALGQQIASLEAQQEEAEQQWLALVEKQAFIDS